MSDIQDVVDPLSGKNSLENDLHQILYGTYGNEGEGALGDLELPMEDLPERELEPDELFILAMYFRGFGIDDMATSSKHSFAFVQNVLQLPQSQRLMARVDNAFEMEIKGMKGLAVKTMRDILQTGDAKAKTTMVEKYFKVAGRFEERESSIKSAEDVIAKMLEVIQTQAIVTKQLTTPDLVCLNGNNTALPIIDIQVIKDD